VLIPVPFTGGIGVYSIYESQIVYDASDQGEHRRSYVPPVNDFGKNLHVWFDGCHHEPF
jgi:hypothetical protein